MIFWHAFQVDMGVVLKPQSSVISAAERGELIAANSCACVWSAYGRARAVQGMCTVKVSCTDVAWLHAKES